MPSRDPRRSRRSILATATIVGLAFAALAGCGGDDESAATTTTVDVRAQYCDAWAELITAFEAYDEIDVVEGGLDSVRTFFDDLETAAQALEDAADDQLQPSADAFTAALEDLGTTLTSSSMPVDRRDQVRAASADVDEAWNDLVAALEGGCPSETAPTVDAGAS